MNHHRTLSQIALVAGTLLFSVGLQTYAQTWSAPTASPPNSNAYAPLTTGPESNVKRGGLLISTENALNGLIVQFGNVGIGTVNPSEKLSVNGIIHSTSGGIRFPDGTVQTTAMAAGGGGSGVYLQDANCAGAGSLTLNSTCEGTLNRLVGNLVPSSAADNTVTIKHPSRNETISCRETTSPFRVLFTADYNLSTDRYTVSGPWVNSVLDIGGSAQGCYSGGCGEAQTNISIGNNVSTAYTRNSSGGITTTIVHNVYMSGSFWLSNGRGSGSCLVGFSS